MSDDDMDTGNGHSTSGHSNGHGVDEDAARGARRMSVGDLRETLGRENLDKAALVELYARTRHSAVPEAAPVASTVSRAARDVRCELAYLGEDVVRRRRDAAKKAPRDAYEEEEEAASSSEDEDEPPEVDGNRLPKRFGGHPRFPSRRARDWALDDARRCARPGRGVVGRGHASAVGRWASRSEENDFVFFYHMKRVDECVAVGARFDEPLTDRDLRDGADRRVDWRCDNDYQYRSKRDETVDELAWRGVWVPRKATEATAKRRLRYDDRGGPSAPEVEEEDEDEDYRRREEEEPVGDVVAGRRRGGRGRRRLALPRDATDSKTTRN